ncbi:DedA family protein [Neomicrococcus aestuarii]|jgi:membrane protein DedA with SNARE-associated domain|uniref:DedA family protein n=1 Tax=Neomicrococcus aestuarii TaxID=556325 RepID=UPI00161C46A9|nr:DedA family protein [Neomicrococcus aestuarii]
MTSLISLLFVGSVAAQTGSTGSSGSWLTQLSDWAVSLMEIIGPPGAALAIALENLFPPLPSEVILPLAGFAAARGSFTLAEALIWTIVGSVVGAVALYWVGRLLGRERTRKIFGWLPLVDISDVDKVEAWFVKHGPKAVFFGRMVPIFRSLISIPAGVTQMPFGQFVLLTTAGSAIWNSIFVLAGFYLGDNWHIVEEYANVFQKIVIVVVVLAIIGWVIYKLNKRRGAKVSSTDER